MHDDRKTPALKSTPRQTSESRFSVISLVSVMVSIFAVTLAMAWAEARWQVPAGGYVRVWPAGNLDALEMVWQLNRLDGVRETVAVFRGSLLPEEYSVTGWATVSFVANGTGAASLAFLPPDPTLTLWKGRVPQDQSLDEALLAYELARSLGLGIGDTLLIRGFPFSVVGIWGPSGHLSGDWVQISAAAAELVDPSSTRSASYWLVIPSNNGEAWSIASRIRQRWLDVEVTSPRREMESARRERIVLLATVLVAMMLALLLGVPACQSVVAGSSTQGAGLVLAAATGGIVLGWAVTTFANLYSRVTLGLTPFSVTPGVVFGALLVAAAIYLPGRLLAAKRLNLRPVFTAVLLCLCAAVVMVAGSLRESLNLTLSTARRVASDWVYLEGAPVTESLLQSVYRLPGVRGYTLEAYGGPALEDDERWQQVPAGGVLYGIELVGGEGSLSLPLQGRYLDGGSLNSASTDQAVIGFDLARERGLVVGDTMVARGVPLQVVGIRDRLLSFPDTDANRRIYVSLETLGRILQRRDVSEEMTLLIPPAETEELKAVFLQEIGVRLRVGQVVTIDNRLAELVVRYPAAWTLTRASSSDAVRHAQSVYDGLLVLVGLLSFVFTSLSVSITWTDRMDADGERIGLLKALGFTEGMLLGGYLQSVMALGAVAGLSGGIIGKLACDLLNGVGHEGAVELTSTPQLAAAVFLSMVFVSLGAAVGPVAGAVRKDATQVLYAPVRLPMFEPLSSTEVMSGGRS